MSNKRSLTLFEKRVERLIKNCGAIPSHAVISLLRKADANPDINIEKEMALLKKRSENTSVGTKNTKR